MVNHSAHGKTVFVAGGSKGIGKGIVEALAADGYDVSLSFRSSPEEASALTTELESRFPEQRFDAYQVDMSEREQVDSFADTVSGCAGLYGLV